MKRGNPHTIQGKGFDNHPENINKNGRPKKLPVIDELLAKMLGAEGNEKSTAESIFDALISKALKGDVRAMELIIDRMYGKVTQTLDHKNNGTSFNSLSNAELIAIAARIVDAGTKG